MWEGLVASSSHGSLVPRSFSPALERRRRHSSSPWRIRALESFRPAFRAEWLCALREELLEGLREEEALLRRSFGEAVETMRQDFASASASIHELVLVSGGPRPSGAPVVEEAKEEEEAAPARGEATEVREALKDLTGAAFAEVLTELRCLRSEQAANASGGARTDDQERVLAELAEVKEGLGRLEVAAAAAAECHAEDAATEDEGSVDRAEEATAAAAVAAAAAAATASAAQAEAFGTIEAALARQEEASRAASERLAELLASVSDLAAGLSPLPGAVGALEVSLEASRAESTSAEQKRERSHAMIGDLISQLEARLVALATDAEATFERHRLEGQKSLEGTDARIEGLRAEVVSLPEELQRLFEQSGESARTKLDEALRQLKQLPEAKKAVLEAVQVAKRIDAKPEVDLGPVLSALAEVDAPGLREMISVNHNAATNLLKASVAELRRTLAQSSGEAAGAAMKPLAQRQEEVQATLARMEAATEKIGSAVTALEAKPPPPGPDLAPVLGAIDDVRAKQDADAQALLAALRSGLDERLLAPLLASSSSLEEGLRAGLAALEVKLDEAKEGSAGLEERLSTSLAAFGASAEAAGAAEAARSSALRELEEGSERRHEELRQDLRLLEAKVPELARPDLEPLRRAMESSAEGLGARSDEGLSKLEAALLCRFGETSAEASQGLESLRQSQEALLAGLKAGQEKIEAEASAAAASSAETKRLATILEARPPPQDLGPLSKSVASMDAATRAELGALAEVLGRVDARPDVDLTPVLEAIDRTDGTTTLREVDACVQSQAALLEQIDVGVSSTGRMVAKFAEESSKRSLLWATPSAVW